MFKITIIVLGKFKEQTYVELEKEFLKRLSPFAKIKIIQLSEVPYRKNDSLDRVKEEEAQKIIGHLPASGIVILLDEKGSLRGSKDFAAFLQRLGQIGKELVFVLGGGLGLHSSLQKFSNYSISLSPLTFPHNLARVIFEEQLYRACTILANKQYHK